MEPIFPTAAGKLGFGCMRLPMDGENVDLPQFRQMVDLYMAAGLNYFDTAHVYIGGQSETALREALVRRYPRDAYFLTDKLSGSCYQRREDIRPLLLEQLDACGVSYFDLVLVHAVTAEVYRKAQDCHAFEELARLRDEGRIRHIGVSFHDKPAVLARVLDEHPEIEVVQIQLNYMDIDNPAVESGAVYDLCVKRGKPVLVMEPVRGGALAKLPPAAEAIIADLHADSPAGYALRYAASFDGVVRVLSGMSTVEQMRDNIRTLAGPQPLDENERAALARVKGILRAENAVPCTGCRYCAAGCPMDIPIPDLFACYNAVRRYDDWPSRYYYGVCTQGHGKPSDCVGCRQCERICPQHLPVTDYLKQAGELLETPAG